MIIVTTKTLFIDQWDTLHKQARDRQSLCVSWNIDEHLIDKTGNNFINNLLCFSYEGKLYTPQESKPANMIVKFPLSKHYHDVQCDNIPVLQIS